MQGTNDSSVVSKVSAAAQGYFLDHFLKHFVCKVSRRAPLINRYVFRRHILLLQWFYFHKTDKIFLMHVYFLSGVIMCAGKQSITVWNSFSMPLNPARGDRWDDMFTFCVSVFTVKKKKQDYLDHIVLLISDSVTWSRVRLPVFPAACRRSSWRGHSFRGWLSRSCPAQSFLDQ